MNPPKECSDPSCKARNELVELLSDEKLTLNLETVERAVKAVKTLKEYLNQRISDIKTTIEILAGSKDTPVIEHIKSELERLESSLTQIRQNLVDAQNIQNTNLKTIKQNITTLLELYQTKLPNLSEVVKELMHGLHKVYNLPLYRIGVNELKYGDVYT